MTAKGSGHEDDAPHRLQGVRFGEISGAERARVLGEAFDYRGDVTLILDDGSVLTGYVFAVEPAGADPHLKMFPADPAAARVLVPLARIAGCEFSGRDTADGRSWEAWVSRWDEKKRLLSEGIDIGDIEPKPETI